MVPARATSQIKQTSVPHKLTYFQLNKKGLFEFIFIQCINTEELQLDLTVLYVH